MPSAARAKQQLERFGQSAYQATTTKIVSRLVAPASLIGSTQQVLVDRNDPSKFIFSGNF